MMVTFIPITFPMSMQMVKMEYRGVSNLYMGYPRFIKTVPPLTVNDVVYQNGTKKNYTCFKCTPASFKELISQSNKLVAHL